MVHSAQTDSGIICIAIQQTKGEYRSLLFLPLYTYFQFINDDSSSSFYLVSTDGVVNKQ